MNKTERIFKIEQLIAERKLVSFDVLLNELDPIDEITFVHPKDMQDGVIEITNRDITTNLPYVDGVHLAFDHHESETIRVGKKDNHITKVIIS